MKKFENLSIRTKLLLSFGLIWLMFFVVIIIAYVGVNGITKSEKELHDVQLVEAVQLQQLRSHQNYNRASMLEMMMVDEAEQLVLENSIIARTDSINNIIERLLLLDPDPTFQKKLSELKETEIVYQNGRKEILNFIKEGKNAEARKLLTGEQNELYNKVRSLALEMGNNATVKADNKVTIDQKRTRNSVYIFILFGVATLIFIMIIVVIINNTVAKPLGYVSETAKLIAYGELSMEIQADKRKDEVGVLLRSFKQMAKVLKDMSVAAQQIAAGDLTVSITPQSENDILGNAIHMMVKKLRNSIKDIIEGINLLGSSVSEILAATTQVASGASETASAISETTTTVEEVRQAAQLSSQKASKVADNAQQVAVVTQSGQKAVEETLKGMQHIQRQMESIANTIVLLSEQSQQIGGIIASVTDVADQSNLLAVNASIEAAKAGEHGKGFAVVAQEIKNLALQSKQATMQVRTILNDIQKATSAAVMAAEQGSKAVEDGVRQSGEAGESIRLLTKSVNESVQAATQISASSQQQTVGMDQIVMAMENINQAGLENAASMDQAQKAAAGLDELGKKLKILVEQYKL